MGHLRSPMLAWRPSWRQGTTPAPAGREKYAYEFSYSILLSRLGRTRIEIRRRCCESSRALVEDAWMPRPLRRGTSCTSCLSRRGRDRCDRLSRRRGRVWALRPACYRSETAFAFLGGAACARFLRERIARDRAAPAAFARVVRRAAQPQQQVALPDAPKRGIAQLRYRCDSSAHRKE